MGHSALLSTAQTSSNAKSPPKADTSKQASRAPQEGKADLPRRRKSNAPRTGTAASLFRLGRLSLRQITGSLRRRQCSPTPKTRFRVQELCNTGPRKSPPLRVGTDVCAHCAENPQPDRDVVWKMIPSFRQLAWAARREVLSDLGCGSPAAAASGPHCG